MRVRYETTLCGVFAEAPVSGLVRQGDLECFNFLCVYLVFFHCVSMLKSLKLYDFSRHILLHSSVDIEFTSTQARGRFGRRDLSLNLHELGRSIRC